MNRRSFFKLFGGAIAAAMLPLGVLALPERKRFEGFVVVHFDYGLENFRDRILEPAMQRIAEQLDDQMMRILK